MKEKGYYFNLYAKGLFMNYRDELLKTGATRESITGYRDFMIITVHNFKLSFRQEIQWITRISNIADNALTLLDS